MDASAVVGERPGPAPSVAAVRAAVAHALPVVEADVEVAEQARRLPDEVVRALASTGMNRMLIPRELGGIEASILDVVEVTETIAAVDGSTGWCAVIGAGSNLLSGYLPRHGAEQVYADPDLPGATMLAPEGRLVPVGGGYRLSGRWPFVSNCLHATWMGLGALPTGVDRPGPDHPLQVVLVPAADLEVEDTWRSAGLRATGSHHVTARDLFVPADRCAVFGRDPWADGRLWRVPIVTMLVPFLAAVTLGVARGALGAVGRQVEGRAARRGQLTDDPGGLADFAIADARLRGARAGLHEVVREVEVAADRREPISPALQARTCVAAQAANDTAVDVTLTAHRLAGASAAYLGSPLLRAVDDVIAARQHLMLAHQHRPELAKAILGLDVRYPPMVV